MVRTFIRKSDMSPGLRDTGSFVEADDINELQLAVEDIQTGTLPVALAGIADALGAYGPLLHIRAGSVYASEYATIAAAAVAAATSGGDVIVGPGIHNETVPIVLTNGVRLIGGGATDRWRSTKAPTFINYLGSGAGVTIAPAAASGADSVEIHNIQIDGRNAGDTVSGVHLDASASGSYIEGVLLANSSITNFGLHQLYMQGIVFDITCNRVTMHNKNRAAGDLVVNDQLVSQLRFLDCWLMNYTDGTWCVANGSASSMTFLGGTVAPYAQNNGIKVLGSASIVGTHIEGKSTVSATTIGVQYVGSSGLFLSPSSMSHHGIGVQIGDGTSSAARGWVIAGPCGFNNVAAGGCDVEITAGGLRQGTILALGFAGGTPTIRNLRKSSDSVQDVLDLTQAGAVRANAYTATNVSTDRTFDADATTLAELADVVGTLIADLRTYGVVS